MYLHKKHLLQVLHKLFGSKSAGFPAYLGKPSERAGKTNEKLVNDNRISNNAESPFSPPVAKAALAFCSSHIDCYAEIFQNVRKNKKGRIKLINLQALTNNMERGILSAIISAVMIAIVIILLPLGDDAITLMLLPLLVALILSFRILFREEKGGPRIISKIILSLPIAASVVWLYPIGVYSFLSPFLGIALFIYLILSIVFEYSIITFDKNSSSMLTKSLLSVLGILLAILSVSFLIIVISGGLHKLW